MKCKVLLLKMYLITTWVVFMEAHITNKTNHYYYPNSVWGGCVREAPMVSNRAPRGKNSLDEEREQTQLNRRRAHHNAIGEVNIIVFSKE